MGHVVQVQSIFLPKAVNQKSHIYMYVQWYVKAIFLFSVQNETAAGD